MIPKSTEYFGKNILLEGLSPVTPHKTNTTFHKNTIILTVKHGGSVNVWGCCPLGSLCGPVSLDLNQTEMLWHGLKHAGKPFIVADLKHSANSAPGLVSLWRETSAT